MCKNTAALIVASPYGFSWFKNCLKESWVTESAAPDIFGFGAEPFVLNKFQIDHVSKQLTE